MSDASFRTLDLPILGMTCASCVGRVEKALRATPGVTEARVNLAAERAHVVLDVDGSPAAVAQAVRSAGYEPLEEVAVYPVRDMTCASCVGRVEAALSKVEGVDSVAVNLATERAEIRTSGPVDRAALVQAVERVGYDVPAATIELAVQGMTCLWLD